ncbi:ATP-dependent DNA ligase [Rhizobium sp. SIMBA_035]
MTRKAVDTGFGLSVEVEPMEARSADALPADEGWQYEPKWDGFRCLAFKNGNRVDLRAKSGKPLGRYFPEVVALLSELDVERFVIDAELVIDRHGKLSFDALQMRLHPAESRIKKLSRDTPARLVMFDMLMTADGIPILDRDLNFRRGALEVFAKDAVQPGRLILSPYTRDYKEAARWLSASGGDTDGVVCKRLDSPYRPGERVMIKVKRLRTADCVVGGFRYESGSKLVGSLLLGLYNGQGDLDHVGFTATITDAERPELTAKLEALRGEPGFSGKAPGGASRWSTKRSSQWEPLKPEKVVEVRFDHVTGHRFRHGTKLLRWRPDKRPTQCKLEQIER